MPFFTRTSSPPATTPAQAQQQQQQQQQRPTKCSYKACAIQHSDTQHLMRRHTDVSYFFRHKGERVKFQRTGKEGDEERPYLCACQQIFHEQNLLAEHLFGTCRVYGTPPTMVNQLLNHSQAAAAAAAAATTTTTMAPPAASLLPSQPQPPPSPAVASPYCPINFQEVLFTKLDQIGEQVAHLNQKLIPQEAFPYSHHHRSSSPCLGAINPPSLVASRSSSLPPSPSSLSGNNTNKSKVNNTNSHGGNKSGDHSHHNSNVHSHTKNNSTRTSRSNSQSGSSAHSGHSRNSSGSNGSGHHGDNNSNKSSHCEELNTMNESMNRLETRFGTLETCCAHILDKLDKVEQRHQELQRDTRGMGKFTELIAGFAKSVRSDTASTTTTPAGKQKQGWRSSSNRNTNTASTTETNPAATTQAAASSHGTRKNRR